MFFRGKIRLLLIFFDFEGLWLSTKGFPIWTGIARPFLTHVEQSLCFRDFWTWAWIFWLQWEISKIRTWNGSRIGVTGHCRLALVRRKEWRELHESRWMTNSLFSMFSLSWVSAICSLTWCQRKTAREMQKKSAAYYMLYFARCQLDVEGDVEDLNCCTRSLVDVYQDDLEGSSRNANAVPIVDELYAMRRTQWMRMPLARTVAFRTVVSMWH